eukprot:scaffold6217_cov125-Isochrysis_galbana.AAC.3
MVGGCGWGVMCMARGWGPGGGLRHVHERKKEGDVGPVTFLSQGVYQGLTGPTSPKCHVNCTPMGDVIQKNEHRTPNGAVLTSWGVQSTHEAFKDNPPGRPCF